MFLSEEQQDDSVFKTVIKLSRNFQVKLPFSEKPLCIGGIRQWEENFVSFSAYERSVIECSP